MRALAIPSPLGDVADRITILTIKSERMHDPARLANVRRELAEISAAFFAAVARTPAFDALFARLAAVNAQLWDIEDAIRLCEARGDFGPEFVRLARSVYQTNDIRAAIKREINALLGSDLVEEKSYTGG
jgi:Family of unknown function (DUF6165)